MQYCSNCGSKTQEGMNFCPSCGQKLTAGQKDTTQEKPKDTRSSTLIVDRAEPTYYSDNKGVRITPTRLIIPGKARNEGQSTYAMANITSIKTTKSYDYLWLGLVTIVIGVLLIAFNSQLLADSIYGVIILSAGIALTLFLFFKPNYHLNVSSASGEIDKDVLPKKDKQYVERVVTAINEALIKRG